MSRRQPTRRQAIGWAILLTVLILIIAGAVNAGISQWLGKDDPDGRFRDRPLTIGQSAEVSGARITVEKFESAYAVRSPTSSAETRATGIYLVFTVTVESFSADTLRSLSGDVEYAGLTTNVRQSAQATPGTAETSRVIAEVDPQRMRGATLRLWFYENTFRYRDRLVIDLGLDTARAAELTAVPRDSVVELEKSRVRGL